MFRPQIQKTKILVLIAFINVLLVVYISRSTTYNKYDNVDLRYNAVELMSNSVKSIKNMEDVEISKEDYYKTGLIGLKKSSITTIFEEQDIDNILNLNGIFHLAAQASVPLSIEDLYNSSSNNLEILPVLTKPLEVPGKFFPDIISLISSIFS